MAEPRVSLWHAEPKPEDTLQVGIFSAAVEAIRLLGQGWTRNQMRCDIDEFEPAVVRHHLRNWDDLASAAAGMSSAGAEPIGSAGEVDARRTLIAIKADLEQGTDWGLAGILHWRWAQRIYTRQGRQSTFQWKYQTFMATWRNEFAPEPSSPLAEAVCIERISRCLGWYPHDKCEKS